jgi:hypothetical protein
MDRETAERLYGYRPPEVYEAAAREAMEKGYPTIEDILADMRARGKAQTEAEARRKKRDALQERIAKRFRR